MILLSEQQLTKQEQILRKTTSICHFCLKEKNEIKNYNIIIKESLANGRIIASNNDKYTSLQKHLQLLAQKYNVTEDAIAIRYCMDAIKGSIVLSGANNLKHLNQNLKASTFKLTDQEITRLESFAISPKEYWEERKQLVWN